MRFKLQNEHLSLKVDSLGAEMMSLRRQENGREYMWSGDKTYWSGVSPLLFPFIGSLKEGKYRYQGRSYSIEKHGFARNMEFKPVVQEENKLILAISDNEDTYNCYPFSFRLEVTYMLEKDGVRVNWRVINRGDSTMYFSIGGHPAFACPVNEHGTRTGCGIRLLGAEERNSVDSLCVIPGGLLNGHTVPVKMEEGKVIVSDTLFQIDTILLEHQITGAALCGQDGKEFVRVESDAPVWGIWSMEDNRAAYICLEPWFGLCDYANASGELESRPHTNRVDAGQTWEQGYRIRV